MASLWHSTDLVWLGGAGWWPDDRGRDARQLVRQLDLFISEKIITGQSSQLGPEFREQFRTRPQLNLENVKEYFSTHPSEVMAFRRYMQRLSNTGFISSDLAESLVIRAFESIELAPKTKRWLGPRFWIQFRSRTTRKRYLTQTPAEETFWVQVTSNKSETDTRQLDFGESLDSEQKALAAQELADKFEEQKRIERNKMLARAVVDEFSQGKPSPESLGRRVERVVTQFAEAEAKKKRPS